MLLYPYPKGFLAYISNLINNNKYAYYLINFTTYTLIFIVEINNFYVMIY
jgi:hypothetical protein